MNVSLEDYIHISCYAAYTNGKIYRTLPPNPSLQYSPPSFPNNIPTLCCLKMRSKKNRKGRWGVVNEKISWDIVFQAFQVPQDGDIFSKTTILELINPPLSFPTLDICDVYNKCRYNVKETTYTNTHIVQVKIKNFALIKVQYIRMHRYNLLTKVV